MTKSRGIYSNVVRGTAEERFWAKVDVRGPDDCWLWQAGTYRGGYGQFGVEPGKRNISAHRFAYELLVGPIPEGVVLDHYCHTLDTTCLGGISCQHRRCVNPAHMDPTTRQINMYRARRNTIRRQQHPRCPNGHEYTPENTYRWNGKRRCRICRSASWQRWHQKNR